VVIRSRAIQDKRKTSRITTYIDCRFEFSGKEYDAVILEISLKSAYLSSAYLPPLGRKITIVINVADMAKPLVLTGKVLRSGTIMSERNRLERFSVAFDSAPLDLIKLISKMASSSSPSSRS
jgi:hypothetical protein